MAIDRKKHVALKGTQCPFCTSTDIEGDSVEVNEGRATQRMGCNECNSVWEDIYMLTGVVAIEDPEEV